ncbi:LacI family DNA-binding transcriptional regulator [Parashewanella tropica]|uniref:LacI family DNA-binding transcriptional regulator n=1 Tax=Parashewanella tropica TaxID=2547970 RepID=UPI00105947D5|nr:LacI family DNA-binding transcriptional regulator [Parashewanella tropica]
MKGKATSLDIAHLAGVSQSTVSRALRNSPLVKKETIDEVKRIAKELNYKVDKHASSLRTQTSNTLALLIFADPTSDNSLINPFFLSMLGSITQATAKKEYDLLLSFQQHSDDWHADFEDSHKADGIILLGYGDAVAFEPKLKQLEEQGTHYVRWGPQLAEHPSVCCDNKDGGFQAATHLLNQGHKRIAFIGDASVHCPEFFDRYQGYAEALIKSGLPIEPKLQADAISTEQSGYEATLALLDSGQEFTALFGASDLIAIGAIKALKDRGKHIPTDVSVVGFDDIQIAQFMNPPLTTIRQDTHKAGEMLVEVLIDKIQGNQQQQVMLSPELVTRNSSKNI